MKVTEETLTLSHGVALPKIGFGTYKLAPGEETTNAVLKALNSGIRHIDSAIIYRNEKSIKEAIQASGLQREDVFITSKCPPHIKTASGARRMFERTLKNLGTDYLDLYIINAPGPFDDLDGDYDAGNVEVYKTLEALYKEERILAIGVSQFKIKDINNILDHCEITPHVNQIAYFAGHTQDELVAFCKKHAIAIQGFSPLGKGYILTNPVIKNLARKYQVSPSQIALRYVFQNDVAAIPKSSNPERIELNASLDFVIDSTDMVQLDALEDDPREYDD